MLIDNGLCLGVDEFQDSLATEILLASVEDTGGNGALVIGTQEARHVGLDHHIFLGHGLALNHTIVHIPRMSQAHKTPGSETLW